MLTWEPLKQVVRDIESGEFREHEHSLRQVGYLIARGINISQTARDTTERKGMNKRDGGRGERAEGKLFREQTNNKRKEQK